MDLTCGRSEAAVLSRALGRRVVGTLDILSHGPVAGLVARAPEPWVRRRIAYWQRILPGDIDPEWAKGLADDMRRIDAILRARTVRVWMAGTCDGLLLAAWTSHLHHALRTKAVLELVQVRRSPIAPIIAFESISRIPPPAARPITGALQTFLLDLWRAWTAAEGMRRSDRGRCPGLGGGMTLRKRSRDRRSSVYRRRAAASGHRSKRCADEG